MWLLYRHTLQARVKFKDNELAITGYDYVRLVIYFLELCSDVLLLWFFSTYILLRVIRYAHSANAKWGNMTSNR